MQAVASHRQFLGSSAASCPSEDQRLASWRAEFEHENGAFRGAFDHSAIGLALVDLDGRWLKVNRSVCEIVGYSPEELLAIDFQSITHPDDLDTDLAMCRRLLDGEIDHYHMGKRYFHKQGHIVWIQLSVSLVRDDQQRPCYFVSQIQDITERMCSEREARCRLQQMERLTLTVAKIVNAFETTADSAIYPAILAIVLDAFESPAGVFLQLTDDGGLRGSFSSPNAKGDRCWAKHDWCRPWKAAFSKREAAIENERCSFSGGVAFEQSVITSISDYAKPFSLLQVANRPNGYDSDDCDMLARIAKIIGSVLSARLERDCKERAHKAAELELAQRRTELARVLRLNTMGEMAAGIAHELNQPLSAISNYAHGCVRRLNKGIGNTPELLEIVNSIADESDRAAEIIRSLERSVKKCESQQALEDINSIVQSAARIAAGEARQSQIAITVNCTADMPLIKCDRVQLEQVIVNLLCNGIEALEGKSEERQLVVETCRSVKGGVEVSIADNGCGLPANRVNDIFEAFFTTKPNGLGMGLAISRTIVEGHGGRLWAEPNGDAGAIFRFMLPVDDELRHAG